MLNPPKMLISTSPTLYECKHFDPLIDWSHNHRQTDRAVGMLEDL